MSRPSSSVPNQWAPLGGCSREGRSMLLGFCGAIHGANSAKMMNTATSTMPVVARVLRFPNAVAALHVVVFIIPSEAREPYPTLTTLSINFQFSTLSYFVCSPFGYSDCQLSRTEFFNLRYFIQCNLDRPANKYIGILI